MEFSIKGFFSKWDQIRRFLRIWPHLLKKSLIENFIFCAVQVATLQNFDFHYFNKGFTILQNEVKVHFEKKDNKLLMLDLKSPKSKIKLKYYPDLWRRIWNKKRRAFINHITKKQERLNKLNKVSHSLLPRS